MRKLWIEQYKGCGCSIGPLPKRKLVGYCAIHGNDVLVRYAVPANAIKKYKETYKSDDVIKDELSSGSTILLDNPDFEVVKREDNKDE